MIRPVGPGASGRTNAHANPPVKFVAMLVPLTVPAEHPVGVRLTPLKAMVSPELAKNPVPVSVNELPSEPDPGVAVMLGIVTVNDWVADWPPTSVALTVVPDVPLGTEKPHAKKPVLFVVSKPLVQVETTTPSKTRERRGVVTENPVPETVTGAPSGPSLGFTLIERAVTSNTTGLVTIEEDRAFPRTSYGPGVSVGTLNAQRNAPVSFVVIVVPLRVPAEQPVGVRTAPLKVTTDAPLTLNPAPVTWKGLPMGP